MKFLCLFLLFIFSFSLVAQDTLHSKYGKSLPAHGTLRILIIYAEIDYDVTPSKDPQANFTYKTWSQGQLPIWKDEMADPFPGMPYGNGSLTQFYKESSFGNLVLLGDYVPFVVTVKESETNSSNKTHAYNQKVLEKICTEKEFISASGLMLKDFDLWTLTSFGKQKITPSVDNPARIDHIMIIYRNLHSLPVDHGFTSQGSPALICGLRSDTYSTFSAPDALPFNVPKHEYAHLLIGDNNFHPSGGTVTNQSYMMFLQLNWSLLSSANATLLTCNGWDRDRLDWKGPGKNFTISAIDGSGNEIASDLNPEDASGSRVYFLRDFVTTGDVIRIKIPVANPESKYPQWLWIENHRTSKYNDSPFDHFQFQNMDCTYEATPGLYMFIQIAKNEKSGPGMYGGYHNYIRSVIASGNYDLLIDEEPRINNCVTSLVHHPYEKWNPNPFTGVHNQELQLFDKTKDGKIEQSEELLPTIEKRNGKYIYRFSGDSSDVFTKGGKRKISISTNPSTIPVINPDYSIKKSGSPANRVILLNGISVEILEELPDGTIKVQVKFDDTNITENVRWCADSIWLPNIKGSSAYSLNILTNKKIHLDQGITPTRFTEPVIFEGKNIFVNPTVMECLPGSSINLNEKSEIIVDNGSTLIINNDCEIILRRAAKIFVRNGSKLILNAGSKMELNKKSQIIVDTSSSIHLNKNSIIKKQKGARIKIRGKKIN